MIIKSQTLQIRNSRSMHVHGAINEQKHDSYTTSSHWDTKLQLNYQDDFEIH